MLSSVQILLLLSAATPKLFLTPFKFLIFAQQGSIPVNQQPAAAKPLGPRRSLLDQFDTATPEPTLSVPSMLTALSMSAPARLHLHGTLQELAASDSGVLGAKQIVDLPSKFKPVRDVSHGALHARSVTAALVRPSPASVLLDTQHSSGDSPEDPNPAEQVLHTNPLSESGDVITCTRTPADDGLTYGAKVEVAACDAKGTFPTGPVEVSPSLLEDPMSASPRTFANHITSAITAAEQALIRSYERSRRIEEDIKRRAAKQRGPVEVSPSLLVETPPDGVAAVTPASGPVKPVRTSIFTIPVEELFMKQEATSLEAPVRTSMATSVVESSAAAKKAPVRTSTFKLPMEQVPRRQQEDIPFEDAPLEREEEGLTSQDLKLGCCMLNCQVQPLLLEQVAHPTEPLRQAPEQQQNQEQEQEQVKLCINEVPSPGAHVQSLPVFHTSNDGLMAETDSEDDISAAAAFAALHTADPHGIRPEFIAARQIELDYQSMATLESAALQMEDAEAEGIALAVAHATQDSPPARIRLRAEADVLIKSAFKVVNGDEEDVQGVEVASLQAALQAADAMAALKMELDAHSQDWAVRCSMNSNGRTQLGKDSALRSSMPCNDEEQLAQAALEGVSSGPKLPAAKLADDEVFMNEFRACRAYAKARAVATIISRLEQEDAIAAVAVAKAAAAAAAIDGAGKEEDLLGAYYPQAGVTGEVLLGGNHQHTAVFSAACNEEEVFWGPEDEVTPVKAPPAAVTAAPLAPATPYVPASDGKSGGKKRRWGALLKRKLAKVFCFRV